MSESEEIQGVAVVHVPKGGAELAPLHYDDAERQIIRTSFLSGASDVEALALIKTAERMKLDVFKRQIHFVQRWNSDKGCMVWAFQTSIDGFRGRAEETGEHEGTDEPVFTFEEVINPITGEPLERRQLVARVTVHRKGKRPTTGTARWSEFVQKTKNGDTVRMWITMPHHMLAKCAEALALRQAFPERLGGLYTEDEMGGGDEAPPPSGGGGSERADVAAAREKLAKQAEKRAGKKAPAEAAPVAPTPAAVARDLSQTVDALVAKMTPADISAKMDTAERATFTGLWNAVKARPDYDQIRAAVAESFARNKARLWPESVKPATPPPAEAPPPRDPKLERWMGEITSAAGNEGEDVWSALNDAFDGQIPVELIRAFEVRWPPSTEKTPD